MGQAQFQQQPNRELKQTADGKQKKPGKAEQAEKTEELREIERSIPTPSGD